MHLRDRHQHAIGAGIAQIEIVLRRAQDRLGAQAEVLSDAVDRVDDVIADLKIGKRDGHAFFDGAHLDALGRCAEHLAIAQDAQAQSRHRESRLDRSVVDVDAVDAGRPQQFSAVRANAELTMQTRSPAATHSRTLCVKSSICRLK